MEKKYKKIISSIAVLILVLAMLPLSNIANEVAVEPDVVQPQPSEQATNDEAAMPSEEEKKPAEEADNSMPQTQDTDETNQPAPAAEEAPRTTAVGTSLDDWNYREEGGKIILTGFKKGNWQDIVIPGKINGKPVALDGTKILWPNYILPGYMNSLTIQAAEDGTKVGVVGNSLYGAFSGKQFKGKVDLRG